VSGEPGEVGGVAQRPRHGVGHRQVVTQRRDDPRIRDGVNVLPDHVAARIHLDQIAVGGGTDQRVAVGQTLGARAEVAEQRQVADRAVLPHDLLGQQLVGFHRVLVEGPRVVAGRGRVDVRARVDAAGIQVRIDLEHVRLRRALIQVLVVVEHQQMLGSGQAGGDPLHVAAAADLLVAAGGVLPGAADRGSGSLAVPGRIAKAVQEIAGRGRRQGDAAGRIAREERIAVVDDVELALPRIDHDLVERLVVVQRIAVQPVGAQRPAGQVEVDLARIVGDRLASADVVGLRGIDVLDGMVPERPLPDDVAAHVDFHDRVNLGPIVRRVRGVAARREALGGGHVLVGQVQRGVSPQLRVVNPLEVTVRMVGAPRLVVLPSRVAVPIQFLQPRLAAGVRGPVQQVAAVQQAGIRARGPRMRHASLHVDEIAGALRAEERIAIVGVGRIPVLRLRLPLQGIVVGRTRVRIGHGRAPGDGGPWRQRAAGKRRVALVVTEGPEDGVDHRKTVAEGQLRAAVGDRHDIVPDRLAGGRHFHDVAIRVRGHQRVAIRQPLRPAADLAVQRQIALAVVVPHDLLGDQLGRLVGHGGRDERGVAGVGRVHVMARVVPAGVQVRIDLHHVGLRRVLRQVLAVVEDQEVPGPLQAVGNPLDVVGAADLFGAGRGQRPVLEYLGLGALVVARRVAEAIQEIAGASGGQGDAGGRVARHERAAVVDDVKLALDRVDDDLVERLGVVQRITVQPIVLKVVSLQVEIQLVRVVGDRVPRAHVVRLRRVIVLDYVIEEGPFPDDGPAGIDLHNRVHLRPGRRRPRRVRPRGDQLVVGQVLVGNVQRGVGVQLGIEDPREVVVRVVGRAGFEIRPHRGAVPGHLFEAAEPARIVGGRIQHVAVGQQMGIVADRPGVQDSALHIQQVRRPADAVEVVTIIRLGRVPKLQLGRPRQRRIALQQHARLQCLKHQPLPPRVSYRRPTSITSPGLLARLDSRGKKVAKHVFSPRSSYLNGLSRKGGQDPFAGTARRVLRTKGSCPLFAKLSLSSYHLRRRHWIATRVRNGWAVARARTILAPIPTFKSVHCQRSFTK